MTDRTVSVRLRLEVSDFAAKTRLAAKSVQDFGTQTQKAFDKHRHAWDEASTKAIVGGAAIAVGVGAAVKSYADFDAQMSRVGAAAQVNGKALDALREAAVSAGLATKYSATDAARAEEELAKAGVSVSDTIGGGLTAALNLAAAGNLDVGEAAETAASAMTQFGLKGKDAGHIADVLAAGAGKAQGSVHDMSMALGQSGLVASQYGISLDETVGALSAFASAGLIGSDAGTSFKTMLQRLNPQSKEASKAMDALGLRAYDAQGQFIGLRAYAGKLQGALKGMSEEQRNTTLQILFGSDAIRAANILYRQGPDGIARWTGKVQDSGYAVKQAAAAMDNLKGDLEKLRGAAETAFLQAGSAADGFARTATQGLTEVIELWSALPHWVQGGTLAFGAVAAASLLAGGATIKLVSGYRSLIETLGKMGPLGVRTASGLSRITGALAGPVGFGVAATLGLATAALGMWAHGQQEARARVEALTDAVREDSGAIGQNVKALTAKKLADADVLEKARTFGLSLSDVTDAALGNADALARVTTSVNAWSGALGGMPSDLKDVRDEVTQSNSEVGKAVRRYKDIAEASGEVADSSGPAADGIDQFGSAARGAASDTRSLDDRLKAFNDTLDDLYASTFGVDEATDNYRDSLAGLAEKAKAARKGSKDHAQAQRDLNAQLRASFSDGLKVAEALAKTGATSDQVAVKTRAIKDEFIRQARAAGVSRTEIARYAAAFDEIPGRVGTSLYITGVDDTLRKLRTVVTAIKNVDGKVIDVRANYDRSGKIARAGGGLIPGPPSTADTVDARLSTGEYVVRAASVQRIGVSTLDTINATGRVPGYASGGLVERTRERRYASGGLVAAARPVAAGSVTYGGDTVTLQLDSYAALGAAEGVAAAMLRKQQERAAFRDRRRP